MHPCSGVSGEKLRRLAFIVNTGTRGRPTRVSSSRPCGPCCSPGADLSAFSLSTAVKARVESAAGTQGPLFRHARDQDSASRARVRRGHGIGTGASLCVSCAGCAVALLIIAAALVVSCAPDDHLFIARAGGGAVPCLRHSRCAARALLPDASLWVGLAWTTNRRRRHRTRLCHRGTRLPGRPLCTSRHIGRVHMGHIAFCTPVQKSKQEVVKMSLRGFYSQWG